MRIAEYKQINTEVTYQQIPILDEEGNPTGEWETVEKEIPIMGMVYRDALPEEEAEMQAQSIHELTHTQPLTVEEKVQMLAEQITEELPQGAETNDDGTIKLPIKIGYRWERKLVGTTVVYESVRDENAIGTQQNPIIYTEDSPLIDNAWYKKDDKLMVYMMGEFEEM